MKRTEMRLVRNDAFIYPWISLLAKRGRCLFYTWHGVVWHAIALRTINSQHSGEFIAFHST